MEKIKGVILILSCHKHLTDRVNKFLPKYEEIHGWKIHVVIGNPFIKEEYLQLDKLLIIKCEDSYAFIMKKSILAYKIVSNMYDIQEGIIRICDDIEIDNNNLKKFLEKENKEDYIGTEHFNIPLNGTHYDDFVFTYYKERPHEMLDPMGGLINIKLSGHLVPTGTYIPGVIVFTSNKSNKILIDYMESINYNVFHKDEIYGYPMIIEDIGVGFILQLKGIKATFIKDFYSNEKNENSLGWHTNLNR